MFYHTMRVRDGERTRYSQHVQGGDQVEFGRRFVGEMGYPGSDGQQMTRML
jgi:hypothetical protein